MISSWRLRRSVASLVAESLPSFHRHLAADLPRTTRMLATLTLRRSVPVSLPTWGAIGGLTLGGSLAGLSLSSIARAPHAGASASVEQIAFDHLVVSRSAVSIDTSIVAPIDAITSGGAVAVLHGRGSAVTLLDARSGKTLATIGTRSDSTRSSLSVAAADSGRWLILDPKRGAVDVVRRTGVRERSIVLPRGFWSGVVWDRTAHHAVVTGVALDGPKTASDGRSIHEFDDHGTEVGAHREIARIEHRLQASFNMPFAAIDGSNVLSGSSLSNEVLIFDRSSATERVVRVADDWFRPIDWSLPRKTVPAKTVAEPTLEWLASQTMLTAIIPLSRGRFIARFTQHAPDRERYVYALVDSVGRTRAVTQPTPVRLSSASGDTVSGLELGPDGRARTFIGVLLSSMQLP